MKLKYKPMKNKDLTDLENNLLAVRFLKSYRELLKEYGTLSSEIQELRDENLRLKEELYIAKKPIDRIENKIKSLESKITKDDNSKKEIGLLRFENNNLKQISVKAEKFKERYVLSDKLNNLLRKHLILLSGNLDLVNEIDNLRDTKNIELIEQKSTEITSILKEKGIFNK